MKTLNFFKQKLALNFDFNRVTGGTGGGGNDGGGLDDGFLCVSCHDELISCYVGGCKLVQCTPGDPHAKGYICVR